MKNIILGFTLVFAFSVSAVMAKKVTVYSKELEELNTIKTMIEDVGGDIDLLSDEQKLAYDIGITLENQIKAKNWSYTSDINKSDLILTIKTKKGDEEGLYLHYNDCDTNYTTIVSVKSKATGHTSRVSNSSGMITVKNGALTRVIKYPFFESVVGSKEYNSMCNYKFSSIKGAIKKL